MSDITTVGDKHENNDLNVYTDKQLEYLFYQIQTCSSADLRTNMVRELWPDGESGFYKYLIEGGKGEVVLLPVDKEDYQYGRLWQIDVDGALNKYLEVINQTPEPWSKNLSVKDRLAKGLTKEGHKKVFLGVDPAIHYKNIWQAWFWTFGIEAESPQEATEQLGFDASELKFIEA